jgi:tetratricopeptide (TPR) repeat protein
MNPRKQQWTAVKKPGLLRSSHPAGWNDRFTVPAVCVLLTAIIWFVFGQTLHHAFVNYDDQHYVYENPIVQKGLTWEGIRWAFTHVAASNWHPLTWISHLLDCQLYGLNPAGHHLTNVLLHTATAILLFLVLREMMSLRSEATAPSTLNPQPSTAFWPSLFVASVFAIHPLRVESVAWVAERKDVLSGMFFMLTLWAYAHYVQKAESRKQKAEAGECLPSSSLHPLSSSAYWLSLGCFALGLMCKPMLVTLPLVLLLLDYWPLQRFTIYDLRFTISRPAPDSSTTSALRPQVSAFPLSRFPLFRKLLLEKLPFLALSAASCAVTMYAQQGALQSLEKIPLPLRLGNAAMAYVAYLGQMFWPARLAVIYPLRAGDVSLTTTLLSLMLLAGLSAWVFVRRRRQPWLLTGWLWYLVMLLPVIGIIQVGNQARADRYTYLPQIGLYLLLTWAAADLCANWRYRRALLGVGAAAILAALIFSARAQAAHWRNSETLWTHTLACTTGNWIAHNNLGDELLKMDQLDDAMAQFKDTLQIRPNDAQACNNLGSILAQKNQTDDAIAQFQKALQIQPQNWQAHGNLAKVLFYQLGRADEAMAHCLKALEIKPSLAPAHTILGDILLQQGKESEALAHYQKALQTQPDSPEILNDISWILATSPDATLRNGAQAVQYATRACDLTKNRVPAFVNGQAAAYAEAGRYDEAIAAAQRACTLASAGGQLDVLAETKKELALYLTHQPYHRPK